MKSLSNTFKSDGTSFLEKDMTRIFQPIVKMKRLDGDLKLKMTIPWADDREKLINNGHATTFPTTSARRLDQSPSTVTNVLVNQGQKPVQGTPKQILTRLQLHVMPVPPIEQPVDVLKQGSKSSFKHGKDIEMQTTFDTVAGAANDCDSDHSSGTKTMGTAECNEKNRKRKLEHGCSCSETSALPLVVMEQTGKYSKQDDGRALKIRKALGRKPGSVAVRDDGEDLQEETGPLYAAEKWMGLNNETVIMSVEDKEKELQKVPMAEKAEQVQQEAGIVSIAMEEGEAPLLAMAEEAGQVQKEADFVTKMQIEDLQRNEADLVSRAQKAGQVQQEAGLVSMVQKEKVLRKEVDLVVVAEGPEHAQKATCLVFNAMEEEEPRKEADLVSMAEKAGQVQKESSLVSKVQTEEVLRKEAGLVVVGVGPDQKQKEACLMSLEVVKGPRKEANLMSMANKAEQVPKIGGLMSMAEEEEELRKDADLVAVTEGAKQAQKEAGLVSIAGKEDVLRKEAALVSMEEKKGPVQKEEGLIFLAEKEEELQNKVDQAETQAHKEIGILELKQKDIELVNILNTQTTAHIKSKTQERQGNSFEKHSSMVHSGLQSDLCDEISIKESGNLGKPLKGTEVQKEMWIESRLDERMQHNKETGIARKLDEENDEEFKKEKSHMSMIEKYIRNEIDNASMMEVELQTGTDIVCKIREETKKKMDIVSELRNEPIKEKGITSEISSKHQKQTVSMSRIEKLPIKEKDIASEMRNKCLKEGSCVLEIVNEPMKEMGSAIDIGIKTHYEKGSMSDIRKQPLKETVYVADIDCETLKQTDDVSEIRYELLNRTGSVTDKGNEHLMVTCRVSQIVSDAGTEPEEEFRHMSDVRNEPKKGKESVSDISTKLQNEKESRFQLKNKATKETSSLSEIRYELPNENSCVSAISNKLSMVTSWGSEIEDEPTKEINSASDTAIQPMKETSSTSEIVNEEMKVPGSVSEIKRELFDETSCVFQLENKPMKESGSVSDKGTGPLKGTIRVSEIRNEPMYETCSVAMSEQGNNAHLQTVSTLNKATDDIELPDNTEEESCAGAVHTEQAPPTGEKMCLTEDLQWLPSDFSTEEPYSNCLSNIEVLDKIKSLWVYRHKTNGLFTYKRGRTRPRMKTIRSMFKKAYEPFVLLSRVEHSPAASGATQLPKLLQLEQEEVSARRRQRKSDLEKVEFRSPCLYGLSPKMPKLLFRPTRHSGKRSLPDQIDLCEEPSVKKAAISSSFEPSVTEIHSWDDDNLEPLADDTISLALERLLSEDDVDSKIDILGPKREYIRPLGMISRLYRTEESPEACNMVQPNGSQQTWENLRKEASLQNYDRELPHFAVQDAVKDELAAPSTTSLTPLDGDTEYVNRLDGLAIQLGHSPCESPDINHTSSSMVIPLEPTKGNEPAPSFITRDQRLINTNIAHKKSPTAVNQRRKQGTIHQLEADNDTLGLAPRSQICSDNNGTIKTKTRRNRRRRKTKRKNTKNGQGMSSEAPVAEPGHSDTAAITMCKHAIPASTIRETRTSLDGAVTQMVSSATMETIRRTRKPTQRLLESIESNLHYETHSAETKLSNSPTCLNAIPKEQQEINSLVPAKTVMSPQLEPGQKLRTRTALPLEGYITELTKEFLPVKQDSSVTRTTDYNAENTTANDVSLHSGLPVDDEIPSLEVGDTIQEEFTQQGAALKGLLEQARLTETEQKMLSEKTRQKIKELSHLQKELENKLRALQGHLRLGPMEGPPHTVIDRRRGLSDPAGKPTMAKQANIPLTGNQEKHTADSKQHDVVLQQHGAVTQQPELPPQQNEVPPQHTVVVNHQGVSLQQDGVHFLQSGETPQQTREVPQKTAMAPRQVGVTPQQRVRTHQTSGMTTQNTVLTPQPSVLAPQLRKMICRPSEVSPQQTGITPQQSVLAPQQPGRRPQQAGVASQQMLPAQEVLFVPLTRFGTPVIKPNGELLVVKHTGPPPPGSQLIQHQQLLPQFTPQASTKFPINTGKICSTLLTSRHVPLGMPTKSGTAQPSYFEEKRSHVTPLTMAPPAMSKERVVSETPGEQRHTVKNLLARLNVSHDRTTQPPASKSLYNESPIQLPAPVTGFRERHIQLPAPTSESRESPTQPSAPTRVYHESHSPVSRSLTRESLAPLPTSRSANHDSHGQFPSSRNGNRDILALLPTSRKRNQDNHDQFPTSRNGNYDIHEYPQTTKRVTDESPPKRPPPSSASSENPIQFPGSRGVCKDSHNTIPSDKSETGDSPNQHPTPKAHDSKSFLKVLMDKPLPAHSKPANYSMYSQLTCTVESPTVASETGLDLSKNNDANSVEAIPFTKGTESKMRSELHSSYPLTTKLAALASTAGKKDSVITGTFTRKADQTEPVCTQALARELAQPNKSANRARKSIQLHQASLDPVHSMSAPGNTSAKKQQPYFVRNAMFPLSCQTCGKTSMFVCSGCHAVAYCSVQCQAIAWKAHFQVCKK